MKTPIYCLSGLGADYRMFSELEEEFKLVHIPWKEPYKNEHLADYALRLVEGINFPDRFYLLGLSFGGVVAQVLAHKFPPEKLILLSTFTYFNRVRWYQRLALNLKLNYLFYPHLFSLFGRLNGFVFGATTRKQRLLLATIIKETSSDFFRWSTGCLRKLWFLELPPHTICLHGTNDFVIPFKADKQVFPIYGAGHFLTLTHAIEIKQILNEHLT